MVQVLSTNEPRHILANPTSRQCVVRSSPFYWGASPHPCESHITAVCGSFKSFLLTSLAISLRIPHHGSVWFVQVLSTGEPRHNPCESHITAVCGSFKSF